MTMKEAVEAVASAVKSAPLEAQEQVIQLLERVFADDADGVERGLAAGLIEGKCRVTGLDPDGELLFGLTDKGRDASLDALERSQEMRDMWNAMGGKQMHAPPKGKQ